MKSLFVLFIVPVFLLTVSGSFAADARIKIDRDRVMLMPLGTDVDELSRVAKWLPDYCARYGLRHCPRRQIEWFGLVRGT